MSAKLIFDHAPIGAIIAYSDGTPRPPERYRRKLADWKNRNGAGRLICKRAAVERGTHTIPASFTLHEGDFGSNGMIVMRVHKTFDVTSPRDFTEREQPEPGSVLVMSRPGDLGELVHLAANRSEAENWLTRHGYPEAVLQEVTVPAPDTGRAA
ncbi:hypothetical protein [Nitratireductor aquibiodomus]|uniref:hypothetical protein n=1 Tax=Nitratireductor aquibiodomus TaxID=204799 RepID=UPI00046AC835|nr:hypothetical protein [Nitratireductor aquibiodomus]